jgi:hypothetical protein
MRSSYSIDENDRSTARKVAHAGASRQTRGRAMVTVEDFSRLVAGIYAAAVTPQHWEGAIRDVHRTLGGIGGALAMAEGGAWSMLDTSMPAAAIKSSRLSGTE